MNPNILNPFGGYGNEVGPKCDLSYFKDKTEIIMFSITGESTGVDLQPKEPDETPQSSKRAS